ncbi:MAG: hypothetical protein R3C99_15365 [Pirellulaceae bacterium]
MSNLFGSYYVKPTATACRQAMALCNNSMRDFQLLRRHALNLAFWPSEADLDWCWIKSLEAKRVGELRVHEVVAQHNNIRIIFFKSNKILPSEPLPRIWTLTVFQKKRDDFSGKEIAAFRVMRDIVVKRWYAGIAGA